MPNVRVIASDLAFPEGPVAMPDGSIILVEIRGRRLTRVHPDGRKEVIAEIPGGPNGAALGPDGKIWICNNGGFSWGQDGRIKGFNTDDYIGGSIQRVDIQSGKLETVFDRIGSHTLKGPNDLVFDKEGGLWFSDLGKRYERHLDIGMLCYITPGGREARQVVMPLNMPNGVGLSPAEDRVYVAETITARLWAFDIARGGTGEITLGPPPHQRTKGAFITGLGGYQMFDSLAVEANGNICVATLVKGAISVIAPDGRLIEQVETGDPQTTNICFGGPELRTAYVTLSQLGQLVAIEWSRPGLPLNFLNK